MKSYGNNAKWYLSAVGYEIYPYSFCDTTGSGYGDLRGIISRLNYLRDLGITLIWLCPVFASPLDDYGYDISDYYHVNPLLGSDDDLKELIDEAHVRGIRIITDLVLNHVSSEHYWFRQAISDKDSPYHDYFIFRPPVIKNGRKHLPNNWMGFFSESVWSYVPQLDEYYFHTFSARMPDLNWENPALRQEMYAVARHYLDMGIDGFRMDAIAHLAKDTSFADSKLAAEDTLVLDTDRFSNRERLFDYLAEFRREVLDHYPDVLTIGEVGGCASTDMAIRYADRKKGSLSMVFNFDTCWENGAYGSLHKKDEEIITNVVSLKKLFKKWYDSCHQYCDMPVYWVNHDHPRVVSQYGNIAYRNTSAKMLGGILMFLYGTPFVYQGEELGMSNVTYDSPEDFMTDVDARNIINSVMDVAPEQLLTFLRRCSRINARTPMQWDDSTNAGFSSTTPYIKVNANYREVNAAGEIHDDDSIWHFYRRLIAAHKQYWEVTVKGSFELIDEEDPDLFMYARDFEGRRLTVIANMKETERTINIRDFGELLISNAALNGEKGLLHVGPYELYVFVK